MNHRKACSHGSIPFSWEQKPGVAKSSFKHQDFSSGHLRMHTLDQAVPSSALPPPSFSTPWFTHDSCIPKPLPRSNIPLPPCKLRSSHDHKHHQSSPKNTFGKPQFPWKIPSLGSLITRWRQPNDPFVAAYKECTKTVRISDEYDKSSTSHGKTHDLSSKIRGKSATVVGSTRQERYCSKFVFSCKTRSDVGHSDSGPLVSHLPPLISTEKTLHSSSGK